MRSTSELRPYQQRLISHLYEHDEALCIVRPGGGKTVVALTAIGELRRDEVIRHALVLAPKRVARKVWPDEVREWAHVRGLHYQVLTGGPAKRKAMLDVAYQYDLTICGLDVVPWLIENLPDEADHPIYDLLVIDEGSRLRNPTGVRAKALAKVANRWGMVWGLSGTLRPSGVEDLFMPARVVTRGKLWGRSFYQWRKEHFYPLDFHGYTWAPFPGAEDKLNAAIAPLTATVAEGELIQPEPQIIFDRVELPAAARRQYDDMHKRLFAGVSDRAVLASSAAVATGKMAQIANGFIYDNGITLAVHDEKREWLQDIIEDAAGPTLLIYEYLQDLALMQELLPDLPYLGAGVGDREANCHIDNWNAGRLPFMGLHPASGGHGLNLQHGGADMAWMSPTWSPEYWDQTIARLNRSGQKRQVMVRVCVATGTVDEMKLDRVYNKMSAQEAFEAYLRQWHAST